MTQVQRDRIQQAIDGMLCDIEKNKIEISESQGEVLSLTRKRTEINEAIQLAHDRIVMHMNNNIRLDAKIEELQRIQIEFQELQP